MDTRELFARLIQCEAGGEGYNGMQGVASVIMNRTNISYGEFSRISQGGNVRNIILQQNQFTCTKTSVGGYYNPQNIYNMIPTDEHYDIADWALGGGILGGVDNSLFFYNPYSTTCATYFPTRVGVIHNRVGNHCFYIPTSYYALT
ncbi:MAG: cell wall hydrolase [Clostridiales bacterium]|nr:cell wall hydrolase [Clostridiales bacterium]